MFSHWHLPSWSADAVPVMILAPALLLVGAVLVFWGWKIYRVALALMGALVGAAVGVALAPDLGVKVVYLAAALALGGAFFVLFMQKTGVFLVGGLWGGFLVLGAHEMFQSQTACYVTATLAFVFVGFAALMLWRPVIIFLLAMFGAGLVADAAGLTLEVFKPGLAAKWEHDHPWIVFAVILAIAAVGLYHQEEEKVAEEKE